MLFIRHVPLLFIFKIFIYIHYKFIIIRRIIIIFFQENLLTITILKEFL